MRPIWTGAIGFGLVNIPVKMYSATQASELNFDMIDSQDQSRIKYQRINESTGKEVNYENIAKAYNYNDHYVILEPEDFEKASPEQTKTINIEDFVYQKEIESIYYENVYYLEPDKSGSRPYALLREALKKSGKVGIATYIMRSKESLGVVSVYNDALILNKIRFAEEIRDVSELKLPTSTSIKKPEMEMALALIDKFSGTFDLSSYKDTYTVKLMERIKAKAKGVKIKEPKLKIVHKKETDLLAQLKASMEAGRKRKSA